MESGKWFWRYCVHKVFWLWCTCDLGNEVKVTKINWRVKTLTYSTLKIWTDFIHRYWRYRANKILSYSSSTDLENTVKVTRIGWHLQTISSKYPCKSEWILATGSWNIGSTSVLKVLHIFLISSSDLENKVKVTKIDWRREITLGKTLYESERDAVNRSGDIA